MATAEHVIWIVTETFGEREERVTHNICWRPTEAEAVSIRDALYKEHAAFARGLITWTNKNPLPPYSSVSRTDWAELHKFQYDGKVKIALALNKVMMRPIDISRLGYSYFEESFFGVVAIGENPGHSEDEIKRIELTLSARVSDNQ